MAVSQVPMSHPMPNIASFSIWFTYSENRPVGFCVRAETNFAPTEMSHEHAQVVTTRSHFKLCLTTHRIDPKRCHKFIHSFIQERLRIHTARVLEPIDLVLD